ncbi:MAG: MFS transporter [Candidatus Methanofastidiosia archaeon]
MADNTDRQFLLVTTGTHIVNDGFEMVVPTLLPIIAKTLQLSYIQIGILGGAMVVTMGLGQAFVGVASDYFGHKKNLIVAGLLITSLSFLLMSASSTYYAFLFANLLAGFGLSVYHPVTIAMIANRFDANKGRAMGIHGSGGNIGMFLFPLTAGFLADSLGWRVALIFFPLVGITIAVIYAVSITENRAKLLRFEPRKLLVPALAIIILSLGLFSMAARGFTVFFPITLGDAGFSSTMIGVFFSLFFGAGIIGQYIGGCLGDRYNIPQVIAILSIIATPSMFLAIHYPQGAVMIIFLIVAGLTVHMIWPLFFVLYAQKTPPKLRSTGLGVFFSIGYLLASTSPVIMGQLASWKTPAVSHYFIIFVGLIGTAVILSLRSKKSYD